MTDNIKLLYIDLFCGAGGTSTGVEQATLHGQKCAKVIACVNHDPNAIRSHAANHPDTYHFTEDIRILAMEPLAEIVRTARLNHPKAKVVLWASLECTNFSKAKGGQPRDADSRTLANHLFRYIEAINPDFIQIDNVEEFMAWGEVDKNGKPIEKLNGTDYVHWCNRVQSYGYSYVWHILNAADYGAYTSRKRFFGQFAKHGLPHAFPVKTYSKDGSSSDNLFNEGLHKYKAVREVLDLDDEGESIFTKKKPLVEATLNRIYAGLIKFVAGGKDAFIVKYNSMNKSGKYVAPSVDEPCPTVAVQNRLGVAKAQFLSKQFSGNPESKNSSIDKPADTVTCVDHHAFVTAYYGNGYNSSIDEPAPTAPTKDRFAIVTSHFLDMQYGNGTPADIDAPSPTVVNRPKQQLVTVKPWLMSTNFNNVGSDIDSPAPVVTASRKWSYLMNPQYASAGGSIDKPCFTLIARMDKMPPYLIQTEEGLGIEVYNTDSPMTRKIKEFMALYGIIDIKMRMLKIAELKSIMGFPKDYVLVGTQSEQKKFIGNAVEVNQSRVLCEALAEKLEEVECCRR